MWYWTKVTFLIFAGAVGVWLLYELITFPGISRLREENPTTSSMIEYRISEAKAEGKEPKKFMIWTPIEQISPNLHEHHQLFEVPLLVLAAALRPNFRPLFVVVSALVAPRSNSPTASRASPTPRRTRRGFIF